MDEVTFDSVMDEFTADMLFDTAVHLAHKGSDNPDDDAVLQMFELLVCAYREFVLTVH